MNKHSISTGLTTLTLLTLTTFGCGNELEGPRPDLPAPSAAAAPPPVDPEIVCRDQLTTEVTLHGERFSPIAIDIPNQPKTALPTIALTRGHALDGTALSGDDKIIYSGEPGADPTNAVGDDGRPIWVDGQPLLQWRSQTEMSFLVTQELLLGERPATGEDTRETGMLGEGVWDVEVKNPNRTSTESVGALAVVDKPELAAFSPGIVCLEQEARTIAITGEALLRNEGERAQVAIEGSPSPFAIELSDCTAVAHDGLDAEVCASADLALARGALPSGLHALTIENPATAACKSVEDRKLRVVPPPRIDRVRAPLACVTEDDRMFVIDGADFLRIDGSAPDVTVAGQAFAVDGLQGCTALETQGHTVERCSAIAITIARDALDPGLHEVTVKNPDPAGCDAVASGALRIVPPPSLEEIEPALVCLDDGARMVALHGTDFLVVDGEAPAVEVQGMALDAGDVTAGGCAELEVEGLPVERCDTLTITLAAGSADLGMPSVRVENPDPAGCSDSREDLLTVIAGPTIASAEPALLCTVDGGKQIEITGSGFLSVDGALPAVTIDGEAVASVDALSGCSAVVANGLAVEQCTSLTVSVALDALDPGAHAIAVQNPDPAGCAATRAGALTVPPALVVSADHPVNVCKNTVAPALALEIVGGGFLDLDGTLPTVAFDGTTVTPVLSECTDLEGDGGGASCSRLATTVALTAAQTQNTGSLPIVIRNAHAAACDLSVTTALNVVDPPMVTAVDIANAPSDSEVCSDTGFTLTITGTGFVPGATVRLVNDDDALSADGDVTFVSATELTAAFGSGLPYDKDDSDYDLVVANAEDGCAAPTIADAIDVNPTPLVFFVDPPVAYNAISVDVTVFASGLSNDSALDTIDIVDSAGTATELTVVDNPKPSRIVANVPAIDASTGQPFAPGEYAVRVTSVLGCVGELEGGLRMTDTLQSALLTSIAPSFVSRTEPTAVTIAGSGFAEVPRVYLSSGSGTATPLAAVEVRSAAELTAVVPAGIAAGSYDLIVVNPNGDVDVLADGLTVTAGAAPVITGVVPASLPANTTGTIQLSGAGFAADAQVALDCLVGGSHVSIAATAEAVAGDGASASANVNLATTTAGSVCVVRLTNGDGSFSDYSAFSVTNSSLNLAPWSTGTQLTTGRRGLSAAAGRPTDVSRFVYAIGGDSGAASDPFARGTVHTTVEAAGIDLFGGMGTWSLQRNDLSSTVIGGTAVSAPRTQAGVAHIGRFIYVIGGHDGTSAQTTLLRAQILDPTAGPELLELDAELGDADAGTGLPGGLYYYRVATLFAGDDASNPGGESLPGELLPVQLPDRGEGIVLSLTWTPAAGAHGYRVYRTPQAGEGAGSLELLAQVTCGATPNALCDCGANPAQCATTDDGTVQTTAGETPLPSGSLGVWHAIDGARCSTADCALGSAREGLTSVVVRDRSEVDPLTDTYYLYALGGRDAGGAYLASVELATVTVTLATASQPESQRVADFANAGDTLLSGRADLGAFVMTAENSAVIRNSATPNDVWLYAGGGRTTGGAFDRNVEAVKIGAAGALTAFENTDDLNGDLAGFGAGASNDQLYTFGGQTSSSGTSAELCTAGGGCGALPDLRPGAFNSLGPAATDRMFMGYAQESAFFLLLGGHDGNATLNTSQKTVQ